MRTWCGLQCKDKCREIRQEEMHDRRYCDAASAAENKTKLEYV
jgi:hypothetical protein